MKRRDPFAIVLGVLSARLRSGAWTMGESLSIAELSLELKFSTTPVREALAFLAGQGAIEDTRGSGYVFGRLDDAGLLDAYELHEMFVLQALTAGEGAGAAISGLRQLIERRGDGNAVWDLPEATHALFEAVVDRGQNRLIARKHQALGALLGRARRSEALLFSDAQAELLALADLLDSAGVADQVAAVRQYGVRRAENVSAIQARSTLEHKLKYTANIA